MKKSKWSYKKLTMEDKKENPTSATEAQPPLMTKLRILKNLCIVCLGFLFLFSAYQGQANLQSTLNIDDNLGVISQSVIYAAMIVSSLFLPKLVIRKFGCKATLVTCALFYAPYIAVNLHPSMATFVPTAIALGLTAPALWSAKCTYLNEISGMYASQSSDSADVVTSRFFGLFFMTFQTTQIWGNLVSYYVLRPSGLDDESHGGTSWLPDNDTVVCGVDFCFEKNKHMESPSETKKQILIGIYLMCVLLAALTMGVFLDSYKIKKTDDFESIFSKILATLKHLKKTDQILLLPLTVFSGLEQGFILGDFTKAYIACAWGIPFVGLVFICFGVVDAFFSIIVGRLVKYVPRAVVFLLAALGNIGVCIALFLWYPTSDQYPVFFILVGVWGFSDSVWQTLLNSLYGSLFRSEEEAAFANYRLWESLGFSIAFAISSVLCVAPKLYILLAFLVAGMIGCMTVEIRVFLAKKSLISTKVKTEELSLASSKIKQIRNKK